MWSVSISMMIRRKYAGLKLHVGSILRGQFLLIRKTRCWNRFSGEAVEPLSAKGLCLTGILDFPKSQSKCQHSTPVPFIITSSGMIFLILVAKHFVIKNTPLLLIFSNMNNVFQILLAMQDFPHKPSTASLHSLHFFFFSVLMTDTEGVILSGS